MKNKKGFTLIELLAVIVIIAVLSVIAIPAYNSIKTKAAERTLENKISMLEVSAYNYGNANKNDVKANPSNYFNVTIESLIENGYLSSESDEGNFILNPVTGISMTETFTITYENYRIKVLVNDGTSGLILIVLNNGGTWSGVTPMSIASGATVTINDPEKNHYDFTGWTVSGAGSSIDGTTFTMGTESTVITANWTISSYTLTVNADGGTWSGTTPQTIFPGETSVIDNPTKSGYVFAGWLVNGTGSSIDGTTFTMGYANTTLTANWLALASMYTYTGNSTVIDDGNSSFRIKFLTSGTFALLVDASIDVFIVGGGGGGGCGNVPGSGGGGGYTGTWDQITITSGQGYSIVVGAGGGANATGGTTTAFGYSKAGGSKGNGSATWSWQDTNGGAGGSGGGGNGSAVADTYWGGGNGGSNGSAGSPGGSGTALGGAGQGTTTREFGEVSGDLYAGGGGGAGYYSTRASGLGGAGGGGRGFGDLGPAVSGTANTGGGGGGANYGCSTGTGSGGSGIVVIRDHR